MTAEQYVALAVSAIGTVGLVLAAILPGQIKVWREAKKTRAENHADHARVTNSVETLSGAVSMLTDQVGVLTTLIIETASDLKAHTKWEEGQKYATPDHIERLIAVVAETSSQSSPPHM